MSPSRVDTLCVGVYAVSMNIIAMGVLFGPQAVITYLVIVGILAGIVYVASR